MYRTTHGLPTIFVLAVILVAVVLYYGAHGLRMKPTETSPISQQSNSTYPGATAPELTDSSCHMKGVLPDPVCTPGVADPAVTDSNIHQTICVSGYATSVRPSVSYTDKLKAEQMTEYGFTDTIKSHEEDHLISLELGGSPTDPKNLWPEPHASPNAKDAVEDFLHTAVCDGRISLQAAQQRIAGNWTTAEQGL